MKRIALLILAVILVCALPLPVLAAEADGAGWGWLETVGRWLNLAILVGAIGFFIRKPLAQFFAGRREEIRREIDEARQAKEAAEQRLAEMEERLAHLGEEIAALRRQAEEDAERERRRIIDQAEKDAEKLWAAASREIDGLSRAAHQELKAYAGELAVRLAEEKVRAGLDSGARKRVVDRFFVTLADLKGRRA